MSGEIREEEGSRFRWLSSMLDAALDACSLTCDNLGDVACHQNGMPAVVFFLYRFVLAGYFFGFLIYFLYIGFTGFYGVKLLIYLTDWTFFVVATYICTAFINVLIDYILAHKYPARCEARSHRFRYQLQGLLFNISITVSIIVTLVYWPILRPMIPDGSKPPLHIDMSIHLFPSIFCLLDLLITKVTLEFAHVVYPLLYIIIYGLFAIFYWVGGGTDPSGEPYIYPIIDFENHPGIAAASMIGIVAVIVIVHAVLKLLCYLRIRYVDRRNVLAPGEMDQDRSPLDARRDHIEEPIV